jgi:hydrogenase-1 operon protein HyaF
MQKLQDIAVHTEAARPQTACYGNGLPILHEILHAMQRLVDSGETTTLDLQAIPFGPGDEEELLSSLGQGEVKVSLDSLGISEIWESRYQGVWVIEHKNSEDERIALQIEVTRIPEILKSHKTDIAASISRLDDQLTTDASGMRGRND